MFDDYPPLQDMTQEDIVQVLKDTMLDKNKWQKYSNLFDDGLGTVLNDEIQNLPVTHVRTLISFGAPIDLNNTKYRSKYDRLDEQEEAVYQFQLKYFYLLQEKKAHASKIGDEFEPSLWSALLEFRYVQPNIM